jgi:hypothetical protein
VVALGITGVRRAAEFWRQGAGLRIARGRIRWLGDGAHDARRLRNQERAATQPDAPQEHPRLHLDLHVADAAEQAAQAERLVSLGAERVDWDSYPDDPDFLVLADPDGNRFCIVDLSHDHG